MTASALVKLGDRVIVDAVLFGEVYPVEVVVVQIDDDGPRGTRIIGRPEGTHSTAFARHQWRPVPQGAPV